MRDLLAQPLRSFRPLALLVEEYSMIGQKYDHGVVVQAETLDCFQHFPIPMIHIQRFSRVVGAQPFNALFRDLDVAVRWLRPAMGAGILEILFQEGGRRIHGSWGSKISTCK